MFTSIRIKSLLIFSQFTGDGAGRDHEGYYWIRGRVDDVVNVSGHRLSTAEIEAALLEHRTFIFGFLIIMMSVKTDNIYRPSS